MSLPKILSRFYPVKLFGLEPEVEAVVEATIQSSYNTGSNNSISSLATTPSSASSPPSPSTALLPPLPRWMVETPEMKEALEGAVVSHDIGRDLCIVGEGGGGKSTMAKMLAHRLGYGTEGRDNISIDPLDVTIAAIAGECLNRLNYVCLALVLCRQMLRLI